MTDAGAPGSGDPDRPRGLLTPADRRFLQGDVTLGSEQSRYDAHYRIRNRLRNGLLDCPVVLRHLEASDRQQVFDPDDDRIEPAVVDAIAALYLGAGSLEADPRRLVEAGVRRAERLERDGECPVLDVDLSVRAAEERDVDRIAGRLEDGQPHLLDDADCRTLATLLAGRTDSGQASELLGSTADSD